LDVVHVKVRDIDSGFFQTFGTWDLGPKKEGTVGPNLVALRNRFVSSTFCGVRVVLFFGNLIWDIVPCDDLTNKIAKVHVTYVTCYS